MNDDQARMLIGTMLSAYPREAMNQETVALWMKMISTFDYDEARRAVLRLVATRHIFPTIAALREEIVDDRLRLPTAEVAYEQWNANALHQEQGSHVEVHPFVREFAKGAGFDIWTMRTDERPGATRAQFIKAYDERRRARVRAANLGELSLLGEVRDAPQIEAPAAEARAVESVGTAAGRPVGEDGAGAGDDDEPAEGR